MMQELQATALETLYDRMVENGQVTDDAAQREVLAILQALSVQVATPHKTAFLSRLFGVQIAPDAIKGVYIWGNVGRGKSMLMELFFENVPVTRKRRVHFHAFMQEIHAGLRTLRSNSDYQGDPVVTLAHNIAAELSLLCFDELQATDVTDASVLHRLFESLFHAGVTIVSTSNHPPASLYTGGVQRERFDKFIALIETHMKVVALSSHSDYRMLQAKSSHQTYFYPLGADADAFIKQSLEEFGVPPAPIQDTLCIQGRKTMFRLYGKDVGLFGFHELCENAMGAADYLAIAKRLKTVIIMDIPALSTEQRNEAKRFVTLIDALYEYKVALICTAATPPKGIYAHGDGTFEFQRTVSRLMEMQSENYRNKTYA